MKERYIAENGNGKVPFFGTFHGLFYKLLGRHNKNIKLIDPGEGYRVVERVLSKTLAEISEDLLTLDKVEAAFTIGRTETNKISISARSLGNYDVKKIMIQLGGGGHKNEAATQITGSTMEEVKNKLIELIKR